ncbi:MAG: helix-turn-helix transcriptional regulator [Candidatus Omnitrophica bacterium]|nr:helix-turn-helix transcriptional regulator [Candidatus Omnitrophota bacterium]
MGIGKKIKQLRKAAKLTQVELAERVGVGLRFIRELERGKPTVRMDKVNQVLEFFGYHVEALRDGKE